MLKRALTIAGSDSGGGAGLQADLKTFTCLKVFGMSAVTAVTVQNTLGVNGFVTIPPETVKAQIDCVLDDIGTDACKTGMLGTKEVIAAVAEALRHRKLFYVLDPVMIAKGGARLIAEDAIDALKKELLPLATIVTPNTPEAEVLSGIKISEETERRQAAEKILALGPAAVVIKGGHGKVTEKSPRAQDDYLLLKSGEEIWLPTKRIETRCDHGTGCTFSAAITAFLAKGEDLKNAVAKAKEYLTKALQTAEPNGAGHCSVNHMHTIP